MEIIGGKWAKSENDILFEQNDKGVFEPIGRIIPANQRSEWEDVGIEVKYIKEIDTYYI